MGGDWVFQNLEDPAATCDEYVILWEEEGIYSCNNFYIVHVSSPQHYSQQTNSNHSCFTLWLGPILIIVGLRNKGGVKDETAHSQLWC